MAFFTGEQRTASVLIGTSIPLDAIASVELGPWHSEQRIRVPAGGATVDLHVTPTQPGLHRWRVQVVEVGSGRVLAEQQGELEVLARGSDSPIVAAPTDNIVPLLVAAGVVALVLKGGILAD